MSTETYVTEGARGQLRAALLAAARRDPNEARELLKGVEEALRSTDLLDTEGHPLADFPQLPFREIRIGEHRLFFRCEQKTVWITGLWKAADWERL